MTEDAELLAEFVLESRENLDQLDGELVELETDPTNADRLSSIFRIVHTIKGTAGFFGFDRLEKVAHAGESLLSGLRASEIVLEQVRTSALLAMVDAIRQLLDQVETTGSEGQGHFGTLIEALAVAKDDTRLEESKALLDSASRSATASADADAEPAAATEAAAAPEPESEVAEAPPQAAEPEAPAPEAEAPSADPPAAEPEPAEPAPTAEAPAAPTEAVRVPDRGPETKIPMPAEASLESAAVPNAPAPTMPRPARHDTRIRVDVGLLDTLMNLVGELVLARNQLLQYTSESADPVLTATSQRLDLITTELQEGVMKTRMQPIDKVWARYPRIVRDLSVATQKDVQLRMDGKATELDKSIIEAIADPLTHIVRNAIDHGLETPEQREAAGKPKQGTIWLRAFHEGGRVNIEIADDGRGVDPEKVKAKAIERGLISADHARSMLPSEAISMLFLAGFSTAEKVTKLSGRGVGMDVVRSNIERIGGSVDLDSKLGQGTTVRIRIPLTLAIVPALVVETRGERFAIPQVNLVELVRLDTDEGNRAVERISGVPLFRLRGNLLALVDLGSVLELPEVEDDGDTNIVVLQADDRQFGLLVDTVLDTEEIVVKPLGRELKGLSTFAGATIMGDGRVALILDVIGLSERAKLDEADRHIAAANNAQTDANDEPATRWLIFRAGGKAPLSIPLDDVARLEEFPRERIEHVGRQNVIQYRDALLPLIDLSEFFGGAPVESESLQVVVHSNGERQVGFVVDSIEDVIERALTVRGPSSRQGVSFTAVIDGKITELLDASFVHDLARH
ncbi:MAG: chemotaxis protein CheW [Myxococcota bacterium]